MADGVQPDQSPERRRQSAELEQVQLRNELLKIELASHGRRKPWYSVPLQMVPMVTAIVAFGGFTTGIVQYTREQNKNRETAEREFMKPWLASQRETYGLALTAAATIPNTEDSNAKQQAVRDFWRLYQGAMILVETETVKDAMVRYGYCLDGIDKCDKNEMNTRCHDLASAMAESMAATAGMTYREFASKQFKYSPGTRLAPNSPQRIRLPDSAPKNPEKSGGKSN